MKQALIRNLRVFLQLFILVYVLGIGLRFYFYLRALSDGNVDVTKPYGVEGFLPISALLGLKQLLLTFRYDTIHPAGLTILISAILMSIIFKKSFCSHICPVGFVSETVAKLGKRWVIPWFIPVWALKYVLLGFFIYIVLTMDIGSIQAFMRSPYNIVADSKMLGFFLHPSMMTMIVLAALLALTFFFRGFWCKNLCPYGALLGLCSVFSPVKVKRDASACIKCGRCRRICPMGLSVDQKNTVWNPDCMGCHECVKNRQNPHCLNTTAVKYNRWIPACIVAVFIGMIGAAMLTGHWESSVTNELYKKYLQIDISHP